MCRMVELFQHLHSLALHSHRLIVMEVAPTAESGFSQTENSDLFFILPLGKKFSTDLLCHSGWPDSNWPCCHLRALGQLRFNGAGMHQQPTRKDLDLVAFSNTWP